MARIPYAPPESPGSDHALNLFRMLAHSPPVLEGFAKLGSALLLEGTLDPRLREMAILRVGHTFGASYEVNKHRAIAQAVGVSETALAATRPDASVRDLAPAERAVLRLTDELCRTARASDEALEATRRVLDDRALVELVVTVGYYALVCRVLETFGVDPEHPSPPTKA